MNDEPIYPKEDPEYRKKVMERFYQQIRNTDWGRDYGEDYKPNKRGRKPKPTSRIATKPRTQSEMKAIIKNKYNWL